MQAVRAGHGPRRDQAGRARPAPDPARPGGRRQGLLVPQDPCLPAQTRHRLHHPRTHRPDQRTPTTRRALCRLDRTAYRRRNVVERCFNRLKQNKALATRYDKRARHYKALVTLACLRLWLSPVTLRTRPRRCASSARWSRPSPATVTKPPGTGSEGRRIRA
ncbi:transposase [Streptomyces niveus]|uniref:transposase n=1 Tax=Streptomyces niveus TaxID=193462 RepID=UPI0035DE5B08